MGWLRTSLRRLRDERATAVALGVLFLITAFVAGTAPRVLGVVARDALRAELSAAQAPARNVQLIEERRIDADPRGPLWGVETLGERREERIPDAVRALFADRAHLVDTSRWSVISDTLPRSTVAFRVQPGAEERIRVADGRLPTGATRTIELPAPIQPEPEPGAPAEPPTAPPPIVRLRVLEVALSVTAADILRVGVGDTIELQVDSTDRLARGHQDRAAIDIVGTFEVTDPADDFWLDDHALIQPYVREISAENAYFDATALLAPDAYPALIGITESSQLPFTYTWRFFVDPQRFDADTVDALLVDLRRFETLFPTSLSATAVQETQLRTDLVRLVDMQRARWRAAEALLTVVAVGPAAVAGAALALVSVLAAQRRRPSLAVWRARGASFGHVVATTLTEGLLLAVPAAVVAAALAVGLLPAGGLPATAVAVAGVAIVALVLLMAAILRATVAESGGRARDVSIIRRVGTRRLAFEVLVVVLAGVGAFLLRERGTRVVSSTGEVGPADPLIASVPLLVGLAAGLLAVRLVPLPIAGLAGLAATRRDLVPVLGLRRATRAGASAVLLVLLATTAVGGFASAALVHLDRSADAVAWQEVGAAYRVSDGGRALPLDLAGALRAEAVAGAYQARVPLGTAGALLQVDLLALDAVAFERAARGTPGAGTVPQSLLAAEAQAPLPAIVGTRVAEGPSGVEPGETFELSIDGTRTRAVAVEVRASFAGAPLGGRFVVLSRDQLQALRPDDPYPMTSLFLRAPGDTAGAAALRDSLAGVLPRAELYSQAERAADLRSGPIPVAVAAGIGVAAAVATAYSALAVVVALALAGAARANEMAHLRTLGLGRRQAVGLLVVEHGPIVGLAFAAGAVVGFGLFVLLRPGLGLEGIIGSQLDVPVRIDAPQVIVLLAGVLAISGAGIVVGAIIQRRRMLTLALRRGIE